MRVFPHLLCTTLALGVAAAAQAPQATPAPKLQTHQPDPPISTITAGTQLVVVDVTVQDNAGNPIHGLKPSDFHILEDKKSQTIKTFDEHSVADLAHVKAQVLPPMPPGNFTDYTPVPADSTLNVLLLDTLNTPMKDQSYVRYQLQQYVKHANPGTRIAIFGLSSRLFLLQGFTSDPDVLKAAVEHRLIPRASVLLDDPSSNMDTASLSDAMSEMGVSASAIANVQQFEASAASFQTQLRTQYTLDAFNQIARYLGTFSGRKNLIWFSGSFPLAIFPDLTLEDPFAVMADASVELRQTTNLLDRARVAVYPIDARGLQTLPMYDAAHSGSVYAHNPGKMAADISKFGETNAQEHATMSQIAEDTGGRAFYNTNGLAEAVAKSIDSGANYYTLTYSPTNRNWNGEYRSIRVQLEAAMARRDVKLTYRHGFYADDPNTHATSSSVLTSAPTGPPATGSRAYEQAAMERGSPAPSEILFKVRVLPNSTATEDKVAEHNEVNPAVPMKGPFRRYDVDFATLASDLALPLQPDGHHRGGVEFLAFVYDADGKLLNTEDRSFSMNLTPETYAQMLKTGFGFHLQVSAPAKRESFLRIGVHDITSGRIGIVEIPTTTVDHLPPPSPSPTPAAATPPPPAAPPATSPPAAPK
jgi:VWFA-related protein